MKKDQKKLQNCIFHINIMDGKKSRKTHSNWLIFMFLSKK